MSNLPTNLKLPQSNIDDSNHPGLHQALSIIPANQTLVNKQRNVLAKNYRRASINDQIVTIDHNDADASFVLPNLPELSDDARIRLMNRLVDARAMNALEETKRLNWWVNEKFSYSKLYSLRTSGDGNCLLHAASLAMWGFHDHALSMRKALNDTLVALRKNNSLYRRWRWAQLIQHKKCNLIFSEDEWKREWEHILRLSSTEPRIPHAKTFDSKKNYSNVLTPKFPRYHSLEEFHVYVLANNIRRPIIIYSERFIRSNNGEPIAPINFGGIYLPLEIPPEKCYKQPIFLAFNATHFSALVPMESKVAYRIPLADLETLELLPMQYFHDPGSNFQWPINEELSDEKINFHSNTQLNQMNTLEKYLNLSKEYASLDDILPPSTSELEHEDQTLTDLPNQKKSSRVSLNAFSKNLRRKITEPFSSTKRLLLKHQQHHHLAIFNENSPQQRSPIFNRNTNMLNIISTNFQPKRLKIADHMINNYLETCGDKSQSKSNNTIQKNLSVNSLSSVYFRHHRTTSSLNQASSLIEDSQKKSDVNDKDDPISTEYGQYSKEINFVNFTIH